MIASVAVPVLKSAVWNSIFEIPSFSTSFVFPHLQISVLALQGNAGDYPRPTVCSCAGGRSPASLTSSSRGPSSSPPGSSRTRTPATSTNFVSSPGPLRVTQASFRSKTVTDRANACDALSRERVQQRGFQICRQRHRNRHS